MDRFIHITNKLWIVIVGLLDLILLSTIFTDLVDAGVKIITLLVGIIIAFFVVKRIKAQLKILEMESKIKQMEHEIKEREIENMIKKKYNVK